VQLNAQGAGPAFATHVCDVEVDPETGHVKVLRYTATQDVGRAIHPSYVEGQIQGGVTQGIGWALSEEYIYDKRGRLDNPGFLDYRCPVASDMPMIDAVMVEAPNPRHPYGVRGVGEVPIVPPMAAVANAIADATGRRLRDLPMSPPKLLAELHREEPMARSASLPNNRGRASSRLLDGDTDHLAGVAAPALVAGHDDAEIGERVAVATRSTRYTRLRVKIASHRARRPSALVPGHDDGDHIGGLRQVRHTGIGSDPMISS
jgi:hypothetical protein